MKRDPPVAEDKTVLTPSPQALRVLRVRIRGFLAGRRLRRALERELGSMQWPLWGAGGGSSVPASRPRPPPPHPIPRSVGCPERPEHSLPVPFNLLSLDGPWLSPGVSAAKKTRGGEAVGTGRARGSGAAARCSLITSARSAPARSRQLPSNAREFNSSINRREALHFGERC